MIYIEKPYLVMGLGSRFWRTYQVDHKGHLQIKDLFGQAADIPLKDTSITTSYGTGVTGLLRKAFKLGTVSIAGSAGHFTCEHIRNPAGFAEILKARALQNLALKPCILWIIRENWWYGVISLYGNMP